MIRQKLGEGGMGEVYLAEHPQIGKKVALKVLHAELSTNQEIATRFFHEAKAVNDIAHPNIVDILDFGQTGTPAGQLMYLVMELLNGSTLTDVLEKGPMDPARALAIAEQVADALAASHDRGIVHRDLKPDNIMLITRGRDQDFVKLLDFGIAKVANAVGGTKTRTGMVMGTPYYMSPEQCDGRGAIDHRTDIYALGIVLYEMLTGRVPFGGEGYGEILVKQMTEAPAPLSALRPGLSPHLEQVVLKALQKRPADRFQTMREFASALAAPEQYVNSQGGLAAFPPLAAPAGPHAATRVISQVPTGHPNPTTLSQSAGQLNAVPAVQTTAITTKRGNKGLLVVGGLIGVGAIAAGVVLLQKRGDDTTTSAAAEPATPVETTPPATTPPPPAPAPAPQQAATPPAPQPPQPQPAPEPPKTVEPPPPANVKLTVDSEPAGGAVYFGTEAKPRCTTPCSLDVPRADSDGTLTIKRSGFMDVKEQIRLNADGQVHVALAKKSSGSSKPTASKPRGTGKPDAPRGNGSVGDNTLNPFEP